INDRRAKRIKLTEESEPFIREVDAVIEKTRREILGGITQDELYTLAEIVRKLDNNIVQLHNRN
ncbi:transcriptional regulator SlyA, partial [Escherichia coli]